MPTPSTAAHTVTLPSGRRLTVSERGDRSGYPVFWCHGGLSSRVDAELAGDSPAASGVHLIAADRPGIGESDRDKGRSVASWAGDVAAIVDDLGIDRFAVAGWSAGGPHTLACAAAMPERVTAVATIGGMAPIRSRSERKELGLATDRLLIPISHRVPWLAGIVLGATRRMKPERLKATALKGIPEPDRAILAPLPADQAVGYTIAALRHGTHGTVDDYRAFGGSWGFDLKDVQAPTRCWQGHDDTLVPMKHARRLAEALPHGSLHEVPDAGHFLVATHGDEVFRGLLEDARA